MDLTDGKLTAGTLPQLWDCSSSNSNQLWDVGYMANNRQFLLLSTFSLG
jgi:hypothetical protein